MNDAAVDRFISQQMKSLQVRAVSVLMAEFFKTVMANCPVEDGHAHEAFLTAMQELSGELSGGEFNSVASQWMQARSKDPEASAGAETAVGEDGDDFVASVRINLPFVRKLEYGGIIIVGDRSGNRGPKANPVMRPPERGPLYGSRLAKGQITGLVMTGRSKLSPSEAVNIRRGIGLLVWEENGVIVRQITRRPKAYAFWRKGISAVRARARQLKLKPR